MLIACASSTSKYDWRITSFHNLNYWCELLGEIFWRTFAVLHHMMSICQSKSITPHHDEQVLSFNLKTKAAGPNNIPSRLLKGCAQELTHIFREIFSISSCQAAVPFCYKTAAWHEVPKKPSVTCLKDCWPVALTSLKMKCFERLLKDNITSLCRSHLTLFNLHIKRTEDAISTAPEPESPRGKELVSGCCLQNSAQHLTP